VRVFYLAWVDEGVAFDAATHATTATKIWDGAEGGEIVFAIDLEHNEGEFPSLTLDLINPGVGLLSAGRGLWIWLSEDAGAGAAATFNGRVVGSPKNLAGQIWQVQFVAKSSDFDAQKAAVAAAKRVLPYFDPVFLQEKLDDPDTVLEAYAARYHIDPVTLEVTTSDMTIGEDGTLEIGEADHFYEDGSQLVELGDQPLERVTITGTVTWSQSGEGDVDLTRELCAKFADQGSPYPPNFVSSLTGDGLLSDWPAPLTDIGGGWSMAPSSSIVAADWLQPKSLVITYGDRSDQLQTQFLAPGNTAIQKLLGGTTYWSQHPPTQVPDTSSDPFGTWRIAFPLGVYLVSAIAHWKAARDRSETVTVTLEADVQSLTVEPGSAVEDKLDFSSDVVGQAVDLDGGLPIGDLRYNSYFKTDRGQQSFQYMLLVGARKLTESARAVTLKVSTLWGLAAGLTCRWNAHVVDGRLSGGEATGKIIGIRRVASGEGDQQAELQIACTIGRGQALTAPAAGVGVYAEDGILADGIQARTGAEVEVVASVLQYQSFEDFEVTDDDGVDLLNMTPARVINEISIANGVTAQREAVNAAAARTTNPDPAGALGGLPTEVTIDLVPVDGGAFRVDYTPDVSLLMIPKTIDLEAA
jgi:hypothetical protein